ncbi:MBL fold metallo-hydrolase [uncultured Cohaesibacter sp.]|uniref:MBL fold metallo-hydrolase n=1 Tax=uncultured Cohaesibacter sp. TaxID=1002546 RepID=UPI0029C6330A|nr:MBL fold metallo-hydrolase [uncultured Cohaesibacter sp.]
MARLKAISGLGRKSAALFLVEAGEQRILFDFGDGLEPGEHPDLSEVGVVDAVCLSHAHEDHAGSLMRLGEVGSPPVYATSRCFEQIPEALRLVERRIIPERGGFDLFGMDITVGQCGHAPGGVWFHLPTERGGFLYSGDCSAESESMPLDPFPRAATLLVDASYGDRDSSLSDQREAIIKAADGGAVICCPAAGRGADMVQALLSAGHAVWAEDCIAQEYEAAMGQVVPVVDGMTACPEQVIVTTSSNAEDGLSGALLARGGFRFLFSSHVPKGSPAYPLIEAGEAQWLPWNVHPRLRDVLNWADQCGADQVIPAFIDPASATKLVAGLGKRLVLEREVEI